MKTRIMIKRLSLGLATMFLMMLSVTAHSQTCTGSQVTLALGNFTTTANTIEYDIYITNTGSTTLKLAGYSGNFRFNIDENATAPAILNGGTGSLQIVHTPSQLTNPVGNFPGFSNLTPLYLITNHQLKWNNTPILTDPAACVTLPTGVQMKFARMRFSTTAATWGGSSIVLTLPPLTNPPLGTQVNTINTFCNGNGSSGAMTNLNGQIVFAQPSYTISLATCATTGTVSGTSPVACFGGTSPATITMATATSGVPSPLTYTYTVDGGSSTAVTANAGGAFTIAALSVGAHTVVVTSTNGSCTTPITVPVTISGPTVAETHEDTISACDSYFWSVTGQTYTSGGDKTGTSTNGQGCTVNETLHLTITPSTTTGSVTTSICEGQTYVWPANGQSYTTAQSGVTVVTGCNTATLNLSINPATTNGSVTTSICEGQTYVWPANGQSYTTAQSGVTVVTGCNTATLNLSINPATTNGSVTTSICEGQTYVWPANGQSYTTAQSGVTVVTGCNTATLNLSINPATTNGSVTTSICEGQTYVWPANGQSYTTAQSGVTVVTGCNTATLNLSINPATTTGSVTTSICEGQTYVWPANGQSYTTAQSGVTVVTGCNTATLNLSVNPVTTTGSESVTACGSSYTWAVSGQTYNASGVYPYVVGCNTATLTLTLNTAAQTYYADTDGDGFGAGTGIESCTGQPANTVSNNTDCAPTDPLKWRTGTFYVDADNDGFYNGNDTPTEACYGASTPSGFTTAIIGADCNDNNAEVNANHVEVLGNGIDDNCSGVTDEDVAGTASYVNTNQCGITLSNIANTIYAYQVVGATGYRFEVTNGATVRTYDSTTNSFNLFNLSGPVPAYGTTYSIRVAAKTGGFWRAYSTVCTVTTPALPATTTLTTTQCGSTIASMSTSIYCNQVTAASMYRFEVSGGSQATRTYDSSLNRFAMTNLSPASNYATTYQVRVAMLIGGVWQDYGAPCSITTPATPPTTSVIASQCGITISNSWTSIYCNPVTEATGYRFEVKNGAQTRFADVATSRFSLWNLAGGPAAGTVYSIRVAILYNGVYQAFGPTCTVTTAAVITRQSETAVSAFAVKASPNPFADTFRLDINTSSEDRVEVKVYDMIGKLVEARQSSVAEMGTLEVGSRFPSGVYNIVVTQGENVKTLRVIKR